LLVGWLGGWAISYRPLRRHRWGDNIRIDIKDVEWEGMECINLAQDRDQWRALVNMVMNPLVP